MKTKFLILVISSFLFLFNSCENKKTEVNENKTVQQTYINPILDSGDDPWAIFHEGKYYYTQGSEDVITLWETTDITDLRNATRKTVWIPKDRNNAFHLWGSEIHFIQNKWYIYFAADDGNMDNHQIYVIENESANPMEGEFDMKGRISTDKGNNWAIHANTFEHNNERYMIWCGWEKRRINAETQCIYIAKMKNPWTLATERVMISKPELEWECQWINPDGNKTAYPIYVNEAPQYFHSKNKDKVLIYYSASGKWTPYCCVGLLMADANSDLTDPASWEKHPEPVLSQHKENHVFGPGNLSFIPSPDHKEWYTLYSARKIPNDASGAISSQTPRLLKVEWDDDGIPRFATLDSVGTPLPLPSGITKIK